jgi:hypothetical protein
VSGAAATLARQRDGGPLDLLPDRGAAVPPVAAALVGVVPWLAVLALADHDGWRVPVAVALGWLVLAGGAAGLRPPVGRLDWAVAPTLHLAEYAGLARLADLGGASSLDTAYALVAVVALHHYDLAYRDGGTAQRLAGVLAGGWPLRLTVAYAAAVSGAARPVAAVAAIYVLGVFAVEAIRTWEDQSRTGASPVADLEEPM